MSLWAKIVLTVLPMLFAALVTIGWQNSHTLVVMRANYEHQEKELTQLRELFLSCREPQK